MVIDLTPAEPMTFSLSGVHTWNEEDQDSLGTERESHTHTCFPEERGAAVAAGVLKSHWILRSLKS